MSTFLSTPSLHALVVGGTSGIGRAIAIRIANSSQSAKVIIAGRSVDKVEQDFKESREVQHNNLKYEKVDCTSMEDVKKMCARIAQDIRTSNKKLDAVFLTQGILTTAGLTLTKDGIDSKMALHYYSRMLIVRELLRLQCLTDHATIMSVLDGRFSDANAKLNWDDLALVKPGSFGLGQCGKHCMAFNDMQLSWFALQGESRSRTYIHAFPGFVKTPISTNLPALMRWGTQAVTALFGVSPDDCAKNLIQGIDNIREESKGGDTNQNYAWNIDSSGKILKKGRIDDSKRAKVSEHTWKVTDPSQ